MPKVPFKAEYGSSLYDSLTGEETPEQYQPRRSTRPKNPSRSRRDLSLGDKPPSRAQRNVRPEEVSERVWGMVEQWLDLGEAHFGKRPPVNRQEFAKRLSAKINSDPNLQRWLRVKPERWKTHGHWESGTHFLNDVMDRVVRLFWKYLTNGQSNTAALQFAFLDDEWDEWVYQAITAVQVAWHQRHGTWAKPDLPSAVFDPSTVGQPEPEDPCTDPLFEGMTWGEVWALDDHEEVAERSEEPIARPVHPSLASVKHAIVANRHTTTAKETTNDEPA